MHSRRRHLMLLLAVIVAACDPPPVDWSEPVAIPPGSPAARVVVDSLGRPSLIADAAPSPTTPAAPRLCTASLAMATGLTLRFAGWWSVRPDSSAALYVAASRDSGRTWEMPRAVDTTDVSSNGCSRPAASVTAVGDDVYVAYSMVAPEGKGVFFAHTMGGMLHSPVAVIYGERLVETAIAADERRVIVAYEEPNGRRDQIDLALSNTQGHIFEVHTAATRDSDHGAVPAAALFRNRIAVSWADRSAGAAAGTRLVRTGTIR